MALNLARLETLFSYIGPAVACVLILRLAVEGLLRRYKFFALNLFFFVAELGVLFTFPSRDRDLYFFVYVGMESLLWFIQILVVIELFSLVVSKYPGIARSGKKFMGWALAIAFAGSLLFAAFLHETVPGRFPVLQDYLLVARVIAFVLLVFLVLIVAFLLWFPIQLSRNVVLYATGFLVYFTCRASTRLADNLLGPEQILVLSTISVAISVGCLAFWAIFLSRHGEDENLTVGHRWELSQTRTLIRQLQSINDLLLGAARK